MLVTIGMYQFPPPIKPTVMTYPNYKSVIFKEIQIRIQRSLSGMICDLENIKLCK